MWIRSHRTCRLLLLLPRRCYYAGRSVSSTSMPSQTEDDPALRTSTAGSSSMKARVLVVGCGRMGQIRAALARANPRFDLCGVVDHDIEKAQGIADQVDVRSFHCLTEAIRETSKLRPLHGLIVSAPTYAHETIIKEAADNRLSVLTEKPVHETAHQIENLFQYTQHAGVHLCCSFQRRFDPSYVAVTRAVQNGQIGTPLMANLFFADHPIPHREFLLTGGNIFMDLSAHDVDYISYTLQDEVTSVYAVANSSDAELAEINVHDSATLVMNFSRGATATLFMSRSSVYGYDQRCEIFGTDGSMSVQNVPETTAVLANDTGIHASRLQHSFPQRFREAFGLELDAFADVLLSSSSSAVAWPVTEEQCVRVQRVADAANLSVACGQVVPVQPYYPNPPPTLNPKADSNDDICPF